MGKLEPAPDPDDVDEDLVDEPDDDQDDDEDDVPLTRRDFKALLRARDEERDAARKASAAARAAAAKKSAPARKSVPAPVKKAPKAPAGSADTGGTAPKPTGWWAGRE